MNSSPALYCAVSMLAFVLGGCTSTPAPLTPDPEVRATDATPPDPYASTARVMRVQGTYQYSFEASVFRPCSGDGQRWWLDAPDAFWDELYALGPSENEPKLDLSPYVEIDVTGTVETLDGPHWLDPGQEGAVPVNGFGHRQAYPGILRVGEVHAIRLYPSDRSVTPPLCP